LEPTHLDVPEAPKVVFERPAPCTDADKAEALLQRTLAASVAPRPSWTVTVRFSMRGPVLVVEGEITDDTEGAVAHRILSEASHECSSLARAIGVWSALVLDSEVERAARASAASEHPSPTSSATGGRPTVLPHDVVLPDTPAEEQRRGVDFGVAMSMMGGLGAGLMGGPILYGSIELRKGWFLKPSLLLERSLEQLSNTTDIYGTVVAGRFDLCGHFSGFHIKHIQLELCGGTEIGFVHFDQPTEPNQGVTVTVSTPTLPFFALGPSVALRGEIGGGLYLDFRGVADLNLLSEGVSVAVLGQGTILNKFRVDPSPFLGRAELGLSWEWP
jgi:hypothetical protein